MGANGLHVNRSELVAAAQRFVAGEYDRLKEAGFINRAGAFYPSVHYPPITMYEPLTQEELFRGYRLPDDGLLDVYAHLPFCLQRCLFCHYPAKLGEQTLEKELYLDAFQREMDIYLGVLGLDRIRARSILIGGGTPTYLSPAQLDRFLTDFTRRVDISACRQFNYDVDPVTLLGPDGEERLRIMRDHGVDRLTIGVQALNEETLVHMNRHHGVRESLDAIAASRRHGFLLNIEFIFGYPGQTLDGWMDDIERAMDLDVDEIQLYRLKVEAYGDYQGPVKKLIADQALRVLSDEETLVMKRVAMDMLAAGGRTENIRRVFCRTRKDYSHYAWNQCCMLYDQVGFGLTAFSSLRDRFGLNTQHFGEYYAAIEEGRLPLNRGLVRSAEEQKRWGIILPLKNSHVLKRLYEERTGVPLGSVFTKKMARLKEYGLVVEDDKKIGTTPLGAFFADEVVQQFHHPSHIPFPREAYREGPLNPYRDNEP